MRMLNRLFLYGTTSLIIIVMDQLRITFTTNNGFIHRIPVPSYSTLLIFIFPCDQQQQQKNQQKNHALFAGKTCIQVQVCCQTANVSFSGMSVLFEYMVHILYISMVLAQRTQLLQETPREREREREEEKNVHEIYLCYESFTQTGMVCMCIEHFGSRPRVNDAHSPVSQHPVTHSDHITLYILFKMKKKLIELLSVSFVSTCSLPYVFTRCLFPRPQFK